MDLAESFMGSRRGTLLIGAAAAVLAAIVLVNQIGAFALLEKEGLTPHPFEGADRGIHTTYDELLGFFKQGLRTGHDLTPGIGVRNSSV